ncbi:unnamed protein product [Brassica oleracea var. botrytis]|uniref:Uncharacterized protein n=2 Tax=Brassica TaxID=3705 RepID=A0A3P6BSL9_BRAOL|nr:unnamed protein product [Brassica napus]CDY27287.1 BnaC04g18670D [Brassica napus]VDD08733.1 unnamed protein product [Brassica oleracea]
MRRRIMVKIWILDSGMIRIMVELKGRKTVRRLRKTRVTLSLARKRMWSRVGKTVRIVRKTRETWRMHDMEQDDEEEEQVVVENETESSEEEKKNETDKTELGTREENKVSEEDYDTEEEAEKRRVEADAAWRRILSESDTHEDVEEKKEVEGKEVQEEAENLEKEAENVAKGTPTPPRGRPKRLAVRKLVLTPSEEFLRGPAVEAKKAVVTEPSPVETEKEAEEMAVEADVVEEEEKPEETDEESPTEKNAEKWWRKKKL